MNQPTTNGHSHNDHNNNRPAKGKPAFASQLKLPLIAAPLFLVSGPELVIASSKAGIVGTFPALNQRTTEGFAEWLVQIKAALDPGNGEQPAPYGVNLIVHATNPRLEADLAVCVEHKVPLVITSLGAVSDVVDAVHSYGGQVFHDVINLRHARKAAAAGVDGLIAVSAGAGGHAGYISPFALVNEIRQFFSGQVILSGCLSTGRDLAAAVTMGADFGYMGTRFINTQESRAAEGYRQMINESSAADIVYTDKVSGVNANFLRDSLAKAGMDDATLHDRSDIDFGSELMPDENGEASAWKDIWSAGQGVGSIDSVPTVEALVTQLEADYRAAILEQAATLS